MNLTSLWRRFVPDSDAAEFIRAGRRKYPSHRDGHGGVILVDFFFEPVVACRYAIVANFLADKLSANIEYFHFHRHRMGMEIPHRVWQRIYRSFGATEGLTFRRARSFEKEAREFAEAKFTSLKTKWDVVNLTIDGVVIGDLVYDSYLRAGRFTVDLKDPALRELFYDSYLMFRASQEYFRTENVRAFFTNHSVYANFGIPVRVAGALGVPIFVVRQDDHVLFPLRKENNFERYPYMHFRTEFGKLPAHEREERKLAARRLIEERLSGKIDAGIAYMREPGRAGVSGYRPAAGPQLLAETGKTRILVMLNCFFDAPHGYRDLLFPDFWDWICFLLERAGETPFDWYVKPHPGGLPGNVQVVERLKKKFPQIRFLDAFASNNQIVAEGISAMFTTYGTAGHEFAYLGIPVVNAGDNPHIAYDFNLHPRTVEEYEAAIRTADRLKPAMDRSDIEEFIYMNYLNFMDTHRNERDPAFEKFIHGEMGGDRTTSAAFRYFSRLEKIGEPTAKYFETFFAKEGVLPERAEKQKKKAELAHANR